jgi:hypothetical protein
MERRRDGRATQTRSLMGKKEKNSSTRTAKPPPGPARRQGSAARPPPPPRRGQRVTGRPLHGVRGARPGPHRGQRGTGRPLHGVRGARPGLRRGQRGQAPAGASAASAGGAAGGHLPLPQHRRDQFPSTGARVKVEVASQNPRPHLGTPTGNPRSRRKGSTQQGDYCAEVRLQGKGAVEPASAEASRPCAGEGGGGWGGAAEGPRGRGYLPAAGSGKREVRRSVSISP